MHFVPHLPADWSTAAARGLPFLDGKMDFELRRDAGSLTLEIRNTTTSPVTVEFAPAYPPCARVTAATVGGASVEWREQQGITDWHSLVDGGG